MAMGNPHLYRIYPIQTPHFSVVFFFFQVATHMVKVTLQLLGRKGMEKIIKKNRDINNEKTELGVSN